ncbi:MAG TPA: hypothetical protein VKA26_07320 [Ignavibacteriaceae bacterium]|nr:hypothetical protein [Ignavibacteriaceae bacterium]
MKLNYKATAFIFIFLLFFSSSIVNAQTSSGKNFVIGGRLGLSLYDGNAGLQIGPTAAYYFNKNMGVSSDFNINTQAGTPIEWNGSFVYALDAPSPNIKPYLDAGMSLFFVTNGPYFGIRFGGGANFKIAPNIYIPADIQLGPVFATGRTVFGFAITSGIRYSLN